MERRDGITELIGKPGLHPWGLRGCESGRVEAHGCTGERGLVKSPAPSLKQTKLLLWEFLF